MLERRTRIVVPWGENAELEGENNIGPLAAHSLEGPPADDLKRLEQERQDSQGAFSYRARAGEKVIDETIYVPPDE